jgi:hypothetical protein
MMCGQVIAVAAALLFAAVGCGAPSTPAPQTPVAKPAARANDGATRCEDDTGCAISQVCCPATTCGFEPYATTPDNASGDRARCLAASCAAPAVDPACPGPFDASKFRAVCTDHVCVRVALTAR